MDVRLIEEIVELWDDVRVVVEGGHHEKNGIVEGFHADGHARLIRVVLTVLAGVSGEDGTRNFDGFMAGVLVREVSFDFELIRVHRVVE